MVRINQAWLPERRSKERGDAPMGSLVDVYREEMDRLALMEAWREVEETCRLGRSVSRAEVRRPE